MADNQILFTEKVRHPLDDSWVNMREFYIDNNSTKYISPSPIEGGVNTSGISHEEVGSDQTVIWRNNYDHIDMLSFPAATIHAVDENYNNNPLKVISTAVPSMGNFSYEYLGVVTSVTDVGIVDLTTTASTYESFDYYLMLLESNINNPLKILPTREQALTVNDMISEGDIILSKLYNNDIMAHKIACHTPTTSISYWIDKVADDQSIYVHPPTVYSRSFSNFSELASIFASISWDMYSLSESNYRVNVFSDGSAKIDIDNSASTDSDLEITLQDFFSNNAYPDKISATVSHNGVEDSNVFVFSVQEQQGSGLWYNVCVDLTKETQELWILEEETTGHYYWTGNSLSQATYTLSDDYNYFWKYDSTKALNVGSVKGKDDFQCEFDQLTEIYIFPSCTYYLTLGGHPRMTGHIYRQTNSFVNNTLDIVLVDDTTRKNAFYLTITQNGEKFFRIGSYEFLSKVLEYDYTSPFQIKFYLQNSWYITATNARRYTSGTIDGYYISGAEKIFDHSIDHIINDERNISVHENVILLNQSKNIGQINSIRDDDNINLYIDFNNQDYIYTSYEHTTTNNNSWTLTPQKTIDKIWIYENYPDDGVYQWIEDDMYELKENPGFFPTTYVIPSSDIHIFNNMHDLIENEYSTYKVQYDFNITYTYDQYKYLPESKIRYYDGYHNLSNEYHLLEAGNEHTLVYLKDGEFKTGINVAEAIDAAIADIIAGQLPDAIVDGLELMEANSWNNIDTV